MGAIFKLLLILFVTTWGRVASPRALYVEQGHI